MENKSELHLLYKKLGETPLACLDRFKSKNQKYADVPMTYAGRLDPMAEGLLLALSGEAVHEKEKYLGLPKTYVCQMLWGFETDTLDVLGIVNPLHRSFLCNGESIKKVLEESVGKFTQGYPVYSSRPVNGKPLFQWAREGRLSEIEIPSHEVELLSADFVSRRTVSGQKLLADILAKIDLVSGDFRQEEIKSKWRDLVSRTPLDTTYCIDTLRLECSSGFYVRQFVADLSKKMDTTATTFHILRERVGDFDIVNIV